MKPPLRVLDYETRLELLGLDTLEISRMRNQLVMTYKILHNEVDLPGEKFFSLSADARTRGHKMKLLKRSANTNTRAHFFSEGVVNSWNALPVDIFKNCCSSKVFAKRLKTLYTKKSKITA